jgi:ubiquinone/menaquinone biosynthesis C-methylase UbiE
MSKTATYIHGTEASEQQRLAALNRLTNGSFVEFLDLKPGLRVLEVGSGLGLLAAAVADAMPDIRVTGLEQASAQIAAATTDSRIRYVQGDAHRLEFDDESFDLVYARYVLEHVADPESVLREMKRVVRKGGRVAVCENDISLLRLDPECPAFERAWDAFQRHQHNLGGDSHIGRRLYRLFQRAGLANVELSVQPEVHWHGSVGFSGWIENILGNIASAQQGLVESGLCDREQLNAAVAELNGLLENSQASSCFFWNRAIAVR